MKYVTLANCDSLSTDLCPVLCLLKIMACHPLTFLELCVHLLMPFLNLQFHRAKIHAILQEKCANLLLLGMVNCWIRWYKNKMVNADCISNFIMESLTSTLRTPEFHDFMWCLFRSTVSTHPCGHVLTWMFANVWSKQLTSWHHRYVIIDPGFLWYNLSVASFLGVGLDDEGAPVGARPEPPTPAAGLLAGSDLSGVGSTVSSIIGDD